MTTVIAASWLAGTIFTNGRTIAIISTIGGDIIMKTITRTTASIYSTFNLFTNHSPDTNVNYILDKLDSVDLKHTITVIDELIKEQGENNKTDFHNSIKISLLGVQEILEKISTELDSIYGAVKNHESKYLSTWRSFDCSINIETIFKHKHILDIRTKMLIDLLKIYKS